jgi:hypothetical protein
MKKIMSLRLTVVLALCAFSTLTARAHVIHELTSGVSWNKIAVQNGNWNSTATWGGPVPATGANVQIPLGLTVTVTHKDTANLKRIHVLGTLSFTHTSDTRLKVDTLMVDSSGQLLIGTVGNPITSPRVAEIVITSDSSVPTGTEGLGRGLIASGVVKMYAGVRASKALLSGDALSGATQLTFNQAPAGWRNGDKIVIPQTNFSTTNALQNEVRTITNVTGNTVTIDQILSHNHQRAETGADFKIAVANLSRPIVIRSGSTSILNRGHVMFDEGCDVFIDGAAFVDLGRSDKRVTVSTDNLAARYALHFHRNYYARTHTVKRSVVSGSPGYGFVNHSSSVNFDDNVAYNYYGAGFVSEAGDEIGNFTNNIAIGGIGDGQELRSTRDILGHQPSIDRFRLGDMGFRGEGFWLVSQQLTVRGNIAAGCNGVGIFHWGSGRREGDNIVGFPLDRYPSSSVPGTPAVWEHNPNMVVGQMVPTLVTEDNTAYGCYQGFKMRYVNTNALFEYKDYCLTTPQAEIAGTNDGMSGSFGSFTIKGIKTWNCLWGMHLTYGVKIKVIDCFAVNTTTSGQIEQGYMGMHAAKGTNASSHETTNFIAKGFRIGIEDILNRAHTNLQVENNNNTQPQLRCVDGNDSQINVQEWWTQAAPVPRTL